jgi:predicted nucleic acid-binding protein
MVRVLLDTCVLSELQRPHGASRVRARVEEIDAAHVFLSVVTFGELVKGIALLEPGARKRLLEGWLLGLEQRYGEHLLAIDAEIARLRGGDHRPGAAKRDDRPGGRWTHRGDRPAAWVACDDTKYPAFCRHRRRGHRSLGRFLTRRVIRGAWCRLRARAGFPIRRARHDPRRVHSACACVKRGGGRPPLRQACQTEVAAARNRPPSVVFGACGAG